MNKEKIPLTCVGQKCMYANCENQAKHKIGELNIWDEKSQKEEYINFNEIHELTTYLCDEHFYDIMKRYDKANKPIF